MTVRFGVETYGQVREEASELMLEHEAEVYRGTIPVKADDLQFEWMDKNGSLQVVAARDDGKLVGYHLTIIKPHLHYAVLAGYVDTVYMAPSHRAGRTGMQMIQYAEDMLRRRGVQWTSIGVRLVKDFSPLLIRLGYTEAERLYRKELK
jgi:GNAT superfamily N-acetyltransferase